MKLLHRIKGFIDVPLGNMGSPAQRSFTTVMMIGLLAIIGLQVSAGLERGGIPAAAICTLLIIRYAFRRPDGSEPDEEVADSCYYLGFVFTLTSLLVSLIFDAADSTNSQQLLGAFGIALTTTLAGVACRAILTLSRPEGNPPSNPADLADKARSQVDRLADAITAHGEAVQILEQRLAKATESLITVETGLEVIATRVGDTLGAVGEQVTAAGTALSSHFGAVVEQVAAAGQALSSRLHAVDVPPDLFTRHGEALAQQFLLMSERQALAVETGLEAVGTRFGETLGAVGEQVATAGQAFCSRLDIFSSRLRAVDVPPDLFTRHGEVLAQQFLLMSERQAVAVETGLEAIGTRFGETLGTVGEQVAEAGQALSSRLDIFSSRLRAVDVPPDLFTRHGEALARQFLLMSERQALAVDRVVATLLDKLRAIEVPNDVIARHVTSLGALADNLVLAIQQANEIAAQREESLTTLSAGLDTVRHKLADMAPYDRSRLAISDMALSIDQVTATLRTFGVVMKDGHQYAKGAIAIAEMEAEAAARLRVSLEEETTAMRDTLVQARKSMEHLLGSLIEIAVQTANHLSHRR